MDFLVVNTAFNTSAISLLQNKATDPGTFEQSTITSESFSSSRYNDVAVGDCDRDGVPDILIGLDAPVGFFPTKLVTLKSTEFHDPANASETVVQSQGVQSIHVADFDGDGNLDLAVMPSSGLIQVFQGDGNCNFDLRWTSGQNFANSPMVVGNVDGFPGPELVVAQGNLLYLYQFDLDTWSFGLALPPQSVLLAGSSLLRLGNVKSSGNLEIVVVRDDFTEVFVYDPVANQLDLLDTINAGGLSAAVGNVRGDRQNELILGSTSVGSFPPRFSSISVFDTNEGLVDRAYTQKSILFTDIAVVDVTGDRLPDIVAFREGLGLTIFPGKADVYGAPQDLGGTTREFLDIKLADIDRDGTLDLYYLATGSSFYGWRAGPTLDSGTETGSSVSEDYQSFAIADLNSDGRMDVVFFSTVFSQKSHRAMGTGTGFGLWESLPFDVESVGSPPQPVRRTVGVVGTFDASGRPEFYVGNADGSDYLLRHDPDVLRELNANSTWRGATAARTHVAAAGDITGDGFTDVVIGGVHATEQTARWLRSDGGGNFFNENVPHLDGATQTGVALADFNNDGLLDIVFAQTGEPNVVLLQGASNSFTSIDWQSPPHLPNTEQTTDVAAVDLNSDGYPDLVFTSKDGDAIQIFFNNGDPINFGFYSAQVFPGGDWEAVAAGDVDNDGDTDLIVAPTNGTLHILQNLLYVEPGVSDTGLLTNQPTTAVVYRPGSPLNLEDGGTGRPVTGEVDVPVLLRDAESDFANLNMEFRRVGSSVWVPFANELRLSATPAGVTHLIPWDTAGLPVGEYELRATVIQTPTVGTTTIGSTIAMSPKVRVGGCLPACLTGEVCVGTSCQPVCALSADCGSEGCYGESFCAPTDPVDAEADVDCLPGSQNDGVDCVPTCIDDGDCTGADVCFPSGCLDPNDLCAHVNCLEGFACLVGECVLDLGECTENSDCDPSAPICYVSGGVGVCATADLCELVVCPLGYSCTLGTCFSDPACVPPEIHYPGFGCGPPPGGGDSPCDGVICPIGQTCIIGGGVGISCEPICSQDADCLEPGHVCYNGEFCGPPNLCGGLVDCPPNFGCSGGGCHPICTSDADCEDPLVCADELCRNVSEPCNGIFCSEFQACYLGSCHPICDDSGDCNPPYSYCMNSEVCLQAYDLCEGLICPFGMACHQGQCVLSCSDTDPCVAPYSCYTEVCAENDCDLTCPDGMGCYQQGCHTVCDDTDDCAFYDVCHTSLITPVGPDRCALEPCGNVFCLLGEACYGGVCYPFCGADGSCDDPDHVCYNNEICLPADPCEGIYCPVGQTCFGGDCRLACSLNNDCPADLGEPQEYCFDGTCASSACEGVTCLKGFTCYGGVCEPDCPSASCGLACIGDACVPDACNSDKFICPVGYACTNGLCEPECTADSDCTADQQCYQGTCNPATCDSVVCPAGQNCHQGICFDDCSDCLAPNICVKDRCVPNHCAALDDEFDDDYIFRRAGGHVSATRHSLPWFWPDPFVGSSFSMWAGLSGNSVTNTDVPALHTARVSLYLDQSHSSGSHPEGRYVLWFNQGAAHGDQRPAQASYRVRVDGVEPDQLLNDDNESWEVIDTDMDDYYVFQAHVTSGSGETGGVAIGRFGSSDSAPWFISIDADFVGDIRRWEWVNADGSVIELDPKETLTLSISSPDGKYYSPAAGRTCSTGLKGICQRGTSYCEQGERRCTPTVLPWAFEICDGLDNNCNGDIDEPDNMRFPGVEWRDDVTSWQLLTTMDKSDAVQSTMNFVPEGTDDRVGSTNLVSSDGSPIQAWNRAVIAMHRDLTTGSLSMLIANGLRETGASMNGIGDYDIETRLSFPGSNTAEEMFPAWWDDRLPAGDGDEIVESFRLDRMDLEWELRQDGSGTSAWREADTVAMMTRWSGATLALREFETRYRWTKENNNSSAPKHLTFGLHQPGQDFRTISRTRTVQVRVTPMRQEDTACWANGLTTVGGCGLGFYQCAVGGVLSCGDPNDAACDRCVDADGDGYAAYDEVTCPTGRDCDDSDASIHPGAHEQCNGRDNDCDGLIDIKDDQAYFDRWGEVRPSGAASCPVGADNCGPQECQFRNVCVCPDGPEDPTDPPSQPCFCGEGLAAPPADESAVCSMP